MRGRAQSRGASRARSFDSSSPNMSNKKTVTKLPQIGYYNDDSANLPAQQSGLLAAVCTQQGKRPYQEDEYAIRPYINNYCTNQDRNVETHFFGLFDGHAGGRCSNHIASCLANVLAEDSAFVTNLPQALKRSFHNANEQFLKIAEKMKYHDGSTGIVAIVRDRKVLVANVGDCRCLIVSGGRAIQMSIDQKPTNPEEQKRIAALGGTVVYCMGVARVNRVLAVSRAFGNRTLRQVIRPDAEMMQRELTKDDDYLVMASDGLWDVMKNKDVCDYCYSPYTHGTPQIIADELVQAALMRGSMDNVTCIVVKLNDYVQRILSGNGSQASLAGTVNPGRSQNTSGRTEAPMGRSSSFEAPNTPNKNGRLSATNNNEDSLPASLNRQNSLGAGNAGSLSSPSKGPTPPLQKEGKNTLLSTGSTKESGGYSSPGGLFTLSKSDSEKWTTGQPPPRLEHMDSIIQDDGGEEDDDVSYLLQQNDISGNSSIEGTDRRIAPLGSHISNSSIPYASRRPNTVGGQAASPGLTQGKRGSFNSGMPHLISMFGVDKQSKGTASSSVDSNDSMSGKNGLLPNQGKQTGGGISQLFPSRKQNVKRK